MKGTGLEKTLSGEFNLRRGQAEGSGAADIGGQAEGSGAADIGGQAEGLGTADVGGSAEWPGTAECAGSTRPAARPGAAGIGSQAGIGEPTGPTIKAGVSGTAAPAMSFKTEDVWLAATLLVCGFLYWELISFDTLGAGVSLFAIALLAASLAYFKAAGVRQTGRSLLWLGLLLLTAAQFALFDNYTIKCFAFLFLSIVYLYWVCVSTGRTLEPKLSIHVLGDLLSQTLVIPFSNFICGLCALTESGRKGRKGGRAALSMIIGLVISLPLLILVVSLLCADQAFSLLVNRFIGAISFANAGKYLLHFIVGIPVALYLYGLLYGDVRGRHTGHITAEIMERFSERIRFAPRLMVYAPLMAFIMVYLVFFASQAANLFSAFTDTLPQAITYAEYARRGFFELCTVAGINLGVTAVACLFMKREEPLNGVESATTAAAAIREENATTAATAIRGENATTAAVAIREESATTAATAIRGENATTATAIGAETPGVASKAAGRARRSEPKGLRVLLLALCALTLLLLATAASKMAMYISYYGLTQLRVYTSWFMLLLAFAFVVIGLRQLREFNATRIIAVGFIVLFMGLCYGNVDGIIAKYNIERYEDGTLEFAAVEDCRQLSDAAAPQLYKLYTETEAQKEAMAVYQQLAGISPWGVEEYPCEKTFRDFNLQSYRAEQIRQQLRKARE